MFKTEGTIVKNSFSWRKMITNRQGILGQPHVSLPQVKDLQEELRNLSDGLAQKADRACCSTVCVEQHQTSSHVQSWV